MQKVIDFFGVNEFIPHGYCLTWDSPLLWLTAISDGLMTLSYATYPIAIAYFVWKRKDLQYRWLYLTFFNAFILTCASTHLMSLITLWIPLYWLDASIKALSALIAAATVFAIWWVIPRALKLPSPAELQKARDQAEAANLAKSAFLANMSHELRTPLNAILGFSSLIQKDEQIPENQRHKLEIINRSGEHLLSLINDVLDMAKIDAGRIYLDMQTFDLGALIRDVTDMMSIRAQEKQLQLLVDQSSKFPRFIVGDQARIRQILINLVGNAVKFTEQGRITLRFGTKSRSNSELIIEIEDTGPGIAPDDQQRIFEPFIQLGDQGDHKGTGLGLTITRQFVQLMGGHLSLTSQLGQGSLFHVELPLQAAAENAHSRLFNEINLGEVIGLAPDQPECRVLIVEDQLENQLLLSQLMEGIGIQTKIAKNGRQGVELFQNWAPHLIWMDRRMPVMDGIEATRAIRSLPNGNQVKIIAVTASAFIEQSDEMLQAGMDDFIRKPYRSNEIYDCLSQHLGLRFRYQNETILDILPTDLTPAMLQALPEPLLQDLRLALESLNKERINAVIERIGECDLKLQQKLARLAGDFDYPAILSAIHARKD